jgi:hypothetical protein
MGRSGRGGGGTAWYGFYFFVWFFGARELFWTNNNPALFTHFSLSLSPSLEIPPPNKQKFLVTPAGMTDSSRGTAFTLSQKTVVVLVDKI